MAPQTETEAIPMLDLISLVLHDEEEVTDIVGILYGLPQIRSSIARKVGWPLLCRSHSM